jgi:hypothetical protein
MSFICGFCKQSTPPNQPLKRVVTETREKLDRNERRVLETVEEKAWCGCSEGKDRQVLLLKLTALSASAVTAS